MPEWRIALSSIVFMAITFILNKIQFIYHDVMQGHTSLALVCTTWWYARKTPGIHGRALLASNCMLLMGMLQVMLIACDDYHRVGGRLTFSAHLAWFCTHSSGMRPFAHAGQIHPLLLERIRLRERVQKSKSLFKIRTLFHYSSATIVRGFYAEGLFLG